MMELVRIGIVKEPTVTYGQRPIANSPENAVVALRDYLEDFAQEAIVALNLDTKCKVINATLISIGTADYSVVTPKEVLQAALLSNAHRIILLHNHPSGDCTPSKDDKDVTERMKKACDIVGVPLADHIIVGDRYFYSFAEDRMRR